MAEIREIRKEMQKKRKAKTVRRIAILVILLSLAVIIFINREALSPEAISNWLGSSFGKGTGEEGFPLSLPSGEVISLESAGNNIVVTNQTNLYFYSSKGRQLRSVQHQKKDAQTKTAGDNALIYSVGGDTASVETATKTVTQLKSEKPIVTGAIAKNGKFALVTESDVYTSELKVFDKNGNAVFKWIPQGGVISSVALSQDGNFVAASTLYTNGGKLQSGIYLFATSKSEALISHQISDELVLSLICGKNEVKALTDKRLVSVSTGDEEKSFSFSEKKLIDYAQSGDELVLVFKDVNDPGKSVFSVVNENCELKSEARVDTHAISCAVKGKSAYILSSSAVYEYEISTGVKKAEGLLEVDGEKLTATNSGVFVTDSASRMLCPDIK